MVRNSCGPLADRCAVKIAPSNLGQRRMHVFADESPRVERDIVAARHLETESPLAGSCGGTVANETRMTLVPAPTGG
jgi:hypothetical protein